MKHSGLADSPFFTKQPVAPGIPQEKPVTEPESEPRNANYDEKQDTVIPRHHDPETPATAQEHHDINSDLEHDNVTPRHHDTTIETVRQAVKVIGKEAATHRFTTAEKEAIAAIVYGVKQQGIRTSENEIARIAVNFILCDYEAKKEQSLLMKVLQALNA
jgi:hypothetical protein